MEMTCNVCRAHDLGCRRHVIGSSDWLRTQTTTGENESADLQLESGLEDQTFGFGADANLPLLHFAGYPSAQVYRSGSTVVAIAIADFSRSQKLWVIREGGESGGEIVSSVELGTMNVEQVLIDGDRLLVIGQRLP